MAVAKKTKKSLQDEVSELMLRVEELSVENQDLREICDENGIEYEEWLAARRHSRRFARMRAEHPIGGVATASDLLGAAPIVRRIAWCTGSVFRIGLILFLF